MAESEEDRLRRLLREAGETVEPTASLENLRARIARSRGGRKSLRDRLAPRGKRRKGKKKD
jgi:hypothetical protein